MKDNKLKICFVLAHFYPHVGGAEKAMLDYILSIKKYNVEVRVITHSDNGIKEHKKYKDIDIYYYNWKILFGHPIVNKNDIKEHIKWADIVHTATYSPVITTSKVCKKLNKPLVVTVFESLNEKWFWIEKNFIKAIMFYCYEKLILKYKCSCYHSISEATTKDLLKNNKTTKINQIYCIVDSNKKESDVKKDRKKISKFFDIPEDNTIFLSYGRPGKTKGILVYLDAIIKTIKKVDSKKLEKIKFCFIMSNDPSSEKQKFLKIVEKENLKNYVIVKDPVERNDLDIYIKSTDYVVVPSITEGFGLTAIEACEAGTKVIHSSAGSLPEVTFGNVVEFENRNSMDLSNKLVDIINGKDISINKNKKDFSSDTIGKQFMDMYKSLL